MPRTRGKNGKDRCLTAANLTAAILKEANLHNAILTASTTWSNTSCPDRTNSNNDGGTCLHNK